MARTKQTARKSHGGKASRKQLATKLKNNMLNGSDNDSDWSMLAPDLIRSVLERLNFVDFHRARCISSNWYSTSKTCTKQNPTPWLILSPKESHMSCKLYDPQHNKTYIVKGLGLDFHRSRCFASSGSWFLMLDHRSDLYILNLFTRERIHLPTLENIQGSQMKFERVVDSESDEFLETFSYQGTSFTIENAVLWVDERSGDYLVVWNWHLYYFFTYHKKGDSNKTWKLFQPLSFPGYAAEMLLRETKLYVLTHSENITIFDFSCGGDDSPKECECFAAPGEKIYRRGHLVITLSGDVLAIVVRSRERSFNAYKLDPKSLKWRNFDSIGNEDLFFDLVTTVETEDRFMENGLCICNGKEEARRCIGILCDYKLYAIQNWMIVPHYKFLAASSRVHVKGARWFFPTFGCKWLS